MLHFMDIVFDRVHLRGMMENRVYENESMKREMEEMWRNLDALNITQTQRTGSGSRVCRRELVNTLRPIQKYNPLKAVQVTTKKECRLVDDLLKMDPTGGGSVCVHRCNTQCHRTTQQQHLIT